LSASLGDDETAAAEARASYAMNGITLNLGVNSFTSDFDTENRPEYELLFPADYQQVSASITKSFERFSLGARANHRKEDGENGSLSNDQYAVFYRQPLFRRKHLRGSFDANFQQDDVGRQLRLQFNLGFGRDRWSGGLRTAATRDENGDWAQGWGLDAGLRSSSQSPLQWQTGAYLRSEDRIESAGASLDVTHPWFTAGVATDRNELSSGATVQNSVATFSAHIGFDREGGAIGGSDFAQAGVIIAVKGEPAGDRFDVVVNNIKMASGVIGSSQFIGLQPFEHYSIKLIPQTTLSNGLGEEVHEFTLYPGSVERIAITAVQEVLLVGTLVDEDGEIISNALMQTEPNPLIVDANGFVQAELAPGAEISVKLADGGYCEFTVPDPGDEEILVLAEPIQCRVIPAPK